jgi:hypothetical protein
METSSTKRHARGLPAPLAQVPFGVLRPFDARDVYTNPRAEFRRLAAGGVLHRLAGGYYAVVPPSAYDRDWLPTVEAAAYGIAAANYGPDDAVLIGLSAARLHGAIPRALSVAVVAVPKQHLPIGLADREATIVFVRSATTRLDAERIRTDLGTALVATVEQTVLDLAHRPALGGAEEEALAAVRALWPRADVVRLDALAGRQRRRTTLARVRDLVDA